MIILGPNCLLVPHELHPQFCWVHTRPGILITQRAGGGGLDPEGKRNGEGDFLTGKGKRCRLTSDRVGYMLAQEGGKRDVLSRKGERTMLTDHGDVMSWEGDLLARGHWIVGEDEVWNCKL